MQDSPVFRDPVFRVQVSGFMIEGSGRRMQVSGLGIQRCQKHLPPRVAQGPGFQGAGFRIQDSGLMIQDYRIQDWVVGSRFRV